MQVHDSNRFDLLIIGGGINGAGIARDAVGRGLSVMLCEKDDLSEGTSSKSSKFVHGGLRYLEHYEFGLVRKALIEREIILGIAPHISRPLKLVLPVASGMRPEWLLRLGLLVYDNLGGRKQIPASSSMHLRDDPAGQVLAPDLDRALAYWDGWIDDSRLVVLNALDASNRGARICTRTELVSARREAGSWLATTRNAETGAEEVIAARAVVNATGPWVEETSGMLAGARLRQRIRLVKGSHLVVKKWWDGDYGFVLQAPDRRIIFVTPYFGDYAMVGTTDVPFTGRLEEVEIDQEEIDYLLALLNRFFRERFSVADIHHCYSGVRPLFDDDRSKGASSVTRDYRLEFDGGGDQAPAVFVLGGKLTTYRKLAEDVMRGLKPCFPGLGGSWTGTEALPGGEPAGKLHVSSPAAAWLPGQLATGLAGRYGSLAPELLEGIESPDQMGVPIAGQLYPAEARWNIEREWASTASDIVDRRNRSCLEFTAAEREALEGWISEYRGGNRD